MANARRVYLVSLLQRQANIPTSDAAENESFNCCILHHVAVFPDFDNLETP